MPASSDLQSAIGTALSARTMLVLSACAFAAAALWALFTPARRDLASATG